MDHDLRMSHDAIASFPDTVVVKIIQSAMKKYFIRLFFGDNTCC